MEYANERYGLLEAHNASLKRELQALREKTQQYSNALSLHQSRVDEATRELLATKERLTKAELGSQSLRSERDLLMESEKRARGQLENVLREQKSQTVLLTNIQTIQNNLERTEFETKTRLGSQIESLQREISLQREKLDSEEERRVRVSEAYESQVRDLDQKLRATKDTLSTTEQSLKSSEEQVGRLEGDISDVRKELETTMATLQEVKDRNLRLEHDGAPRLTWNLVPRHNMASYEELECAYRFTGKVGELSNGCLVKTYIDKARGKRYIIQTISPFPGQEFITH